MNIKKIYILIAIVTCFHLTATIAFAENWTQTWAKNAVNNYHGARTSESQKRGFATFGHASLRTPVVAGREQLFNYTKPRYTAGCGGIDIHMGGFSMMNFDYLVQKVQRIISGVPAFAFKYAMEQLDPIVGNITDQLEKYSDMATKLALDECRASNQVVTLLTSSKSDTVSATENATEASLEDGDTTSWYADQEEKKADQNKLLEAIAKTNSGCPDNIKTLFIKGSVVKQTLDDLGYPEEIQNVIRGLIGDIAVIKDSDELSQIQHLPPCLSNQNNSLEAFINGDLKIKKFDYTKDPVCESFTGGDSLKEYVGKNVKGIYNNMKNGVEWTPEQEAILAIAPINIFEYLKLYYINRASVNDISGVIDAATSGFSYQLMANIIIESKQITTNIKRGLDDCSKESGNEETNRCAICSQEQIREEIEKFEIRIATLSSALKSDWNKYLETINTQQINIEKVKNTRAELLKKRLTASFPQ
jgi:conjugative transfer pilus assembly protein TraH